MKNRLSESLDAVTESIRREFDAQDAARERALTLSREIIRSSSIAIKCVHREQFSDAQERIKQTLALVTQLAACVQDYDDLKAAGFVLDGYKEYVEAVITHALITESSLPSLEEVGMPAGPYVNGLAECVGEMRRYVLDSLRHGRVEQSESMMETMDDIYHALLSLDYPEAVTQGLRRRADAARGMIERTRGEVTSAVCQERLRQALERGDTGRR